MVVQYSLTQTNIIKNKQHMKLKLNTSVFTEFLWAFLIKKIYTSV